MTSINNIDQLILYYESERKTNNNEINSNIHKPINIYIKNISKSSAIPIHQIFNDIEQLVAYLKKNKYSPNTIRNYVRYLSDILDTHIVKNTFPDENIYNAAKIQINSLLKTADTESDAYNKSNKQNKANDNDSEISNTTDHHNTIDIDTIQLNLPEHSLDHNKQSDIQTLLDKIQSIELDNDNLRTSNINYTIEITKLQATNVRYASEVEYLRNIIQLIHQKHT